tara:strand:- start:1592 stop:1777 length:186 start_codon:yes stop_codon:yes gene_type:complete
MFNKRGQGLSVETIIIVIIALLVLVVVILIFTGQSGEFFDTVKEFISGLDTPNVDYTEVSG